MSLTIKEHLSNLLWDGKPRLDTWLTTYCNATGDTSVGREFLVSAVGRAFDPGRKVPFILSILGAQGIGKSRMLQILGDNWYDEQLGPRGSLFRLQQLRRGWIIELSADPIDISYFIDLNVDEIRLPRLKRQFVMVITTNEPLMGLMRASSRIRPVVCGKIDLDGLMRDRDHLLAEAVQAYIREAT